MTHCPLLPLLVVKGRNSILLQRDKQCKPISAKNDKYEGEWERQETGQEWQIREMEAVRCNKVIVTLHDPLHITELELIVSVETLDSRAILIPIF